jgi:hypothetical protein
VFEAGAEVGFEEDAAAGDAASSAALEPLPFA